MTQFTGNLDLRVLGGDGTEHVLTSASGLRAGLRSKRGAVERGEIKQQDIALEAAGRTLFGAPGRAALPAPSVPGKVQGGYRAELRHKGVPVLSGVIPRVSVEHHVRLGVWTFPLLAAASEDFWNRMEGVGLLSLSIPAQSELAYVDGPYVVQAGVSFGAQKNERFFRAQTVGSAPARARFYDLYSVIRAVLADAGVALTGPLPDWPYTVETPPGPVTRSLPPRIVSRSGFDAVQGDYSPTSLTLPAWSGRALLEAVLEATGWIAEVEYAPFPLTDLSVRFHPFRAEPDTSGLPALDGREAVGGYTEAAEPPEGGADGMQTANAFAGASPKTEPPRVVPPGALTSYGYTPAPPPPRASLALARWQFDRDDDSGRTKAPEPVGDVTKIKFALPSVAAPDLGSRLPEVRRTAGGVSESLVYGLPVLDRASVYLLSVGTFDPGQANGGEDTYTVWARVDETDGRLGLETWAEALYRMRASPTGGYELAKGDWYVNGLDLEPGRASRGASVGGVSYVVHEIDRRLVDDKAALTLARPASDEGLAPDYGTEARIGEVSGLSVRFAKSTSVGGSTTHFLGLIPEWAPPDAEHAAGVAYYEVQFQKAGDTAGAWLLSHATAYPLNVEQGETYTVRVRAVGRRGERGGTSAVTTKAEPEA